MVDPTLSSFYTVLSLFIFRLFFPFFPSRDRKKRKDNNIIVIQGTNVFFEMNPFLHRNVYFIVTFNSQFYTCHLDICLFCLYKRYFIKDQQIARHSVHYSECLSNPLPFYSNQIINPFLNSRISANDNKGLEFQPIVKSLYCLMFL